MTSKSSDRSDHEKSSGQAFAVIIALLASFLVVAPVAQVANASGSIVHNDQTCQLSTSYAGTGAPSNPYLISDSESLWEITDCSLTTSGTAAFFEISNDIDLSEVSEATTSTPIGYEAGSPAEVNTFSGVLRGNGHRIRGISMSASMDNNMPSLGLFAHLHNATIQDLHLYGTLSAVIDPVNFDPLDTPDFGIGALAGYSTGNLIISGVENYAAVSGTDNVGGLVGLSRGTSFIRAESKNLGMVVGNFFVGGFLGKSKGAFDIRESGNSAEVSGVEKVGGLVGSAVTDGRTNTVAYAANGGAIAGDFAGGLVGNHQGDRATLLVEGSTNNGVVVGTGTGVAGGLIGNADAALIRNSLNRGPIQGVDGVGGLFGGFVSFSGTLPLRGSGLEPLQSPSEVTVEDSSNYGMVSGRYNVGGLIGASSDSRVVSSTNSGAVSASFGVGGLIGALYGDGEVFSSTNLLNIMGLESVGGLIGTAARANISNSSNLGAISGTSFVGGLFGGFVRMPFGGTFLFPNAEPIEVPAEVRVEDVQNSGPVNGIFAVGGLIGATSDFNIVSSFNSAAVSGSAGVGGLIGSLHGDGMVLHGYNWAPIRGQMHVGGLLGLSANHDSVTVDIHQSSNSGEVVAIQGWAGGLLGSIYTVTEDSNLLIVGSLNTGDVSGIRNLGGLGGFIDDTVTVDRSANSGDVFGAAGDAFGPSEATGGLLGFSQRTSIEQSINSGAVFGGFGVGGLLGLANAATVSASMNVGTVSGLALAGGLVGVASNLLSPPSSFLGLFQSANTGAVLGGDFIGGLVGRSSTTIIDDSYNVGAVSGLNRVGGLIGLAEGGVLIETSYNAGTVSGLTFADGVIGDFLLSYGGVSVFSTMDSEIHLSTSAAALRRADTYGSGFDFTNTWGFGSCSDNNGFPMLKVLGGGLSLNSVGCVAPSSAPPSSPSSVAPLAPTPTPAPTQTPTTAAYNGPVFDFSTASGVIGTEFVMTGQRLGMITSLRIGDATQVLTSVSATAIRFTVTASTKLGLNDIVVVSSFGVLSMPERIRIEAASPASVTVSPTAPSPLIGKTRMLSKNDSVNRVWFEENLLDSGIKRLLCTAVVSQNATNHQRVLARKQAIRHCSIAADYLIGASTWVQTKVTQNPRGVGRVLLTKRG